MGRPHCVDGEGRWAGRTVWMGRASGQAALCGWGGQVGRWAGRTVWMGGQVGRPHCVDGEGRWAGRTVWMGRAGGQAALCGWGGQVGRPHCVDGEGRWAGRTVWMGRAGGLAALCGWGGQVGRPHCVDWESCGLHHACLTAPLVCCLKQGPDLCGFGALCFSAFPPSSDPGVKEGDVVCYGQHVTLTTLPGVGGQVSTPHTRVHLLRASHR